MQKEEENIYVALTYDHLNATAIMDRVKSPKAGAVVLFAGMTYPTKQKCSILIHYRHNAGYIRRQTRQATPVHSLYPSGTANATLHSSQDQREAFLDSDRYDPPTRRRSHR